MKMQIVLSLAILIGLSTSNLTFLEMTASEGEITIVNNCLEGAPYIISKSKPSPPAVQRGADMSFVAVGAFNVDTDVQQLNISTKINGIDAQNVFEKLAEPGLKLKDVPFSFKYGAKVPALAPPGKYEVLMYLIDNKGKKVSCLLGTFTLGLPKDNKEEKK